MKDQKMRTKSIVICIALFLLLSIKPYEGSRILDEEEEELFKKEQANLLLQSLQKKTGGGTPSPNPCGFIPGGHGHCKVSTITEMNFAAQLSAAAPPPPPPPPPPMMAYPQKIFQFGIADNNRI